MRLISDNKIAEATAAADRLLKKVQEAGECPCQTCIIFNSIGFILQQSSEKKCFDTKAILGIMWRISEHLIRTAHLDHQHELRDLFLQAVESGHKENLDDDNINAFRTTNAEENEKLH